MEFSSNFKYRKFWTRIFIGIFVILILYPIKSLLIPNIERYDLYISASLSLTMIFMFLYYSITSKYFIKEGKYNLYNKNIEIYMNDKLRVIKLDRIKEISYMRRHFFGEEYILLTIIQYKGKKIKVISDNISSDYDITTSPLYKIYQFAELNSEHLNNAYYNNPNCFVLERNNG